MSKGTKKMKTWDDLSDFEINKTLFPFTKYFGECKDIMQKKNPNRSAVMWGDGANWFEFDGCNNPAHMWQIITENGISLIKLKVGYVAVSPNWDYIDLNGDSNIENCCIGLRGVVDYGHEKPLRAAAIVFLMMNGVNPK